MSRSGGSLIAALSIVFIAAQSIMSLRVRRAVFAPATE